MNNSATQAVRKMKGLIFSLMLLAIVALPFGIGQSDQGFVIDQSTAQAEENSFDDKLMNLEDRMHMMKMVIKRLRHTFIKAKEDHAFMVEHGMPAKDVARLEQALQSKIKKMINEAIQEINAI